MLNQLNYTIQLNQLHYKILIFLKNVFFYIL